MQTMTDKFAVFSATSDPETRQTFPPRPPSPEEYHLPRKTPDTEMYRFVVSALLRLHSSVGKLVRFRFREGKRTGNRKPCETPLIGVGGGGVRTIRRSGHPNEAEFRIRSGMKSPVAASENFPGLPSELMDFPS